MDGDEVLKKRRRDNVGGSCPPEACSRGNKQTRLRAGAGNEIGRKEAGGRGSSPEPQNSKRNATRTLQIQRRLVVNIWQHPSGGHTWVLQSPILGSFLFHECSSLGRATLPHMHTKALRQTGRKRLSLSQFAVYAGSQASTRTEEQQRHSYLSEMPLQSQL